MPPNLTGIQPPPRPAERGNQRAVKHGLYVKAPSGLKLRYRKVRRLVNKMKAVMPWLDAADDPACRAWAELEILGAYAFADLTERGLTNRKGEPRRLLAEFRMLRQAQLAFERELGMTPAARLGLRVADSRGRAYDDASPVSESDLLGMEERILARLHDRPAEDGDRPALAAEATPAGAGDETSSDASRDARELDE